VLQYSGNPLCSIGRVRPNAQDSGQLWEGIRLVFVFIQNSLNQNLLNVRVYWVLRYENLH